MAERGVTLTNGAGLSAIPIAEYAVMAMLTVAKGWREVVRAQERREWLGASPGTQELFGTAALILGAGGIGSRLADLLRPWDVAVTTVRRNPQPGDLGTGEWRARLAELEESDRILERDILVIDIRQSDRVVMRLGVEAAGQAMAITINISSPDADGFRRSRAQVAAAIGDAVRRGARLR